MVPRRGQRGPESGEGARSGSPGWGRADPERGCGVVRGSVPDTKRAAPVVVRRHGLQGAHTQPLVGELRSWRTSPAKASEVDAAIGRLHDAGGHLVATIYRNEPNVSAGRYGSAGRSAGSLRTRLPLICEAPPITASGSYRRPRISRTPFTGRIIPFRMVCD